MKAIVVAIGAVIAIGYGTGLGSGNQVTYLIEPLRRADIDLFTRDWFAMNTTHYHGAFVALATELFRVDSTGAVFGVAHLITMVSTIAALHRILVVLGAPHTLALLFVLVGWIVLGGGRAVGGSYLVATYFQPSSVATISWLAAMAFWLGSRHLPAGIALAVGGAFHANFLVLGIAYFGALELITRDARPRRAFALLAPSLVVLAAMLPEISAASDAREPALALRILVEFHAPTHYDAGAAIAQLPPLLAWLLVAWGVRPSRSPVLARLWKCALVGTAMCALIFVAIVFVPSLTRLFIWRIAPFAQLASQIVVLAVVFGPRGESNASRVRSDRWRAFGIPIGVGVVLGWSIPHAAGLYTFALVCTVLAAIVYRYTGAVRPAVPIVAGVIALLLAVVPVTHSLVAPRLFTEALGGRYGGVIKWARTTERDALFVIPPYLHSFRLLTRRAIVVDSRSPPLYPDELVVWYRRSCALVGVDNAATHEEIEARYDRLAPGEMVAAARRFDAQYVVIDKQRSAIRLDGPPAYEDGRVVVFRVAPP